MSFALCCVDLGYYEQILVTETSCFVTSRKTEMSPIEGGIRFLDPEVIAFETARFDRIFEANYRGRDREVYCLE